MNAGEEDHYEYLMHSYMVHIDDVASAQIYLLEYPNAQGRYICSSAEMTMHQMYGFLLARYPEFQLPNMEEWVFLLFICFRISVSTLTQNTISKWQNSF